MRTDFSNRPISKRAIEMEDIKNLLAGMIVPSDGPLANVFGMLAHAIPFVPGLGWAVYGVERLASFFGWGMRDIGGAIDRYLGLHPGDTSANPQSEDIETGLDVIFKSIIKDAASKGHMEKVAYFGGLVRLISAIPRFSKVIWKGIQWILLTLGANKLGELYTANTGAKKAPGEVLVEELAKSDQDKKKEDTSLMTSSDVEGLMGLVTNPMQLVGPLLNK